MNLKISVAPFFPFVSKNCVNFVSLREFSSVTETIMEKGWKFDNLTFWLDTFLQVKKKLEMR